jgi:hypothetical protein
MPDQKVDHKVTPARTCGMQWEDAVKDGVDRLPMRKSILYEADVARS